MPRSDNAKLMDLVKFNGMVEESRRSGQFQELSSHHCRLCAEEADTTRRSGMFEQKPPNHPFDEVRCSS